jgi:hypothetical protein
MEQFFASILVMICIVGVTIGTGLVVDFIIFNWRNL